MDREIGPLAPHGVGDGDVDDVLYVDDVDDDDGDYWLRLLFCFVL